LPVRLLAMGLPLRRRLVRDASADASWLRTPAIHYVARKYGLLAPLPAVSHRQCR
jgi:hypothetical protein